VTLKKPSEIFEQRRMQSLSEEHIPYPSVTETIRSKVSLIPVLEGGVGYTVLVQHK
jgi:hypothetical protein